MAGVFTFHMFFAFGGIFWEGGLDFYLGLCSPRNDFRHGGSVLRAVFLVLPRPPPDTIAVDFTFSLARLYISLHFLHHTQVYSTLSASWIEHGGLSRIGGIIG